MKIEDLLSPDLMIMDLKATTQEEAIKEMADLEVKQDVVNNEDEFIKSIWARERINNWYWRWNCYATCKKQIH